MGQGFGFGACGLLPQASDGESMRHPRELDASPNGWARRLRPTGAVTSPRASRALVMQKTVKRSAAELRRGAWSAPLFRLIFREDRRA